MTIQVNIISDKQAEKSYRNTVGLYSLALLPSKSMWRRKQILRFDPSFRLKNILLLEKQS